MPRGRGILGVLITDAQVAAAGAITDDPRSVGFPPNHPPMRGFLGVPILLRGRAYGNLYLTEKADGPFSAEDQELVETLASQAAVAIENARLLSRCDQLVGAARGAERGRDGAGGRDRAAAPLAAHLPAPARPDRRAGGDDRVSRVRTERCGSKLRTAPARTRSSACGSSGPARRAAACSSASEPNGWTALARRSRGRPERDEPDRRAHRPLRPAPCRRCGRSASSSPTTRRATIRASPTTTSGSQRSSPHAPRSPSTCRRELRATRSAASSRRRSSNDAGWPASSTTRPGRS